MKCAGLKIPLKSTGPCLNKAQKPRHPNKINHYHYASHRARVAPGIMPHPKDKTAAQKSIREEANWLFPYSKLAPCAKCPKSWYKGAGR